MSKELLEELAAEVENYEPPVDLLQKISESTLEYQELLKEKKVVEEKLLVLNAKIAEILETTIPDLMFQARMKDYTMNDGSSVEVKNIIKASIKVEDRQQAMDWFRSNGYGDLIKNEVSVSFGKGQDEDAEKAVKALEAQGFQVSRSENIHFMTLNAWAKEQLEQGKPIPEDKGVSLYLGTTAKIKEPKEPKK